MTQPTQLQDLLKNCEDEGHRLVCYYDSVEETDYVGSSATEAHDALMACDEMHLVILDSAGDRLGWAFIVNGNDDDEQISDHSGEWLGEWLDAFCPRLPERA